MKEREVKIRIPDILDFRSCLNRVGVQHFSLEYQLNKIFDTEDNYLKKNNQIFRWRQTLTLAPSLVSKLTWKVPQQGSIYKLVEENEVFCSDEFAGKLTKGLVKVIEYSKERNKYKYKGAEIHLDTLRYGGALKKGVWYETGPLNFWFVEIEADTDGLISEIITDLHLDRRRITKTSYPGIIFRLAKIIEE